MGCCASSTTSETPINNTPSSSHPNASKARKEDKIELAFKAKRANVFTQGVDLERQAYVQKKIPKNEHQSATICKSSNSTICIVFY